MIGCRFLHRISEALSKAKECKDPFGGINIIFAGDFAQLSPVGDSSLCSRIKTERVSTTAGQNAIFGKLLWFSIKTVVMLKVIKRQDGSANQRFVDLLSRLRFGQCTDEDFKILNNRLASKVKPDWTDSCWENVPLIVSDNDAKDALNAKMAETFALRTGRTLHWYIARD
ncbi:hypothetical protein F5878DRAFT_505669, partial [Lentinula raphanica]